MRWLSALSILMSSSIYGELSTISPIIDHIEISHDTFGTVEAHKPIEPSHFKCYPIKRLTKNLFPNIYPNFSPETSKKHPQLVTKNQPSAYFVKFYLPNALKAQTKDLKVSIYATEAKEKALYAKKVTALSEDCPAGLFALAAEYPADTENLTQSQVVFLSVNLGERKVTLIPEEVLFKDDRGCFVYVLKQDSYIEKRYVQKKHATKENMVAVTGLSQTDKIALYDRG